MRTFRSLTPAACVIVCVISLLSLCFCGAYLLLNTSTREGGKNGIASTATTRRKFAAVLVWEYTDRNGKAQSREPGRLARNAAAFPAGNRQQETGDAEFEKSREEAAGKLAKHAEDAKIKRPGGPPCRKLHLPPRRAARFKYTRLADLPTRLAQTWAAKVAASEAYLKGCDSVFNRFAAFIARAEPGRRSPVRSDPGKTPPPLYPNCKPDPKLKAGLARKTSAITSSC